MKYLIIIIGLFPLFLLAQPRGNATGIDSISYIKVAGEWLRKEHRPEEVPQVYTTDDEVVARSLEREYIDLSRQYRQTYLNWKKEEKDYQVRLRQIKKEYKKHFASNLNVDSIADSKQLIGNWLFNGELITVAKKLEIKSAKVEFISDVHFEVNIAGVKRTFFLRGDNWVTDNELYKLEKVKQVNK